MDLLQIDNYFLLREGFIRWERLRINIDFRKNEYIFKQIVQQYKLDASGGH